MTIFEQTGWKRSHPQQICQDLEALERVSVFTYDAFDEAFLDYFTSRTGYGWRKANCSPEMMKQIYHEIKTVLKGKHHQYTRAKLQDCWELYQAELKERAA